MKTQYQILSKLLTRKTGCTSVDICNALPSVSPHRRLADMREMGWTILKKKNDNEKLIHYFGKPPKTFS